MWKDSVNLYKPLKYQLRIKENVFRKTCKKELSEKDLINLSKLFIFKQNFKCPHYTFYATARDVLYKNSQCWSCRLI